MNLTDIIDLKIDWTNHSVAIKIGSVELVNISFNCLYAARQKEEFIQDFLSATFLAKRVFWIAPEQENWQAVQKSLYDLRNQLDNYIANHNQYQNDELIKNILIQLRKLILEIITELEMYTVKGHRL